MSADASTTTATTDTAAAPADTGAAATTDTTQQNAPQDSSQAGQDTTQTGQADGKPAAQADGDQQQGKEPGKEDGDKPAGAPEQYEPFKLPDGVTIDPADNEALQAYAKEHNLTQESAQKLADLGAKQAQTFVSKLQEAQEARNAEWTAASKADKEFGGDKLDENLAVAKTFLDAHATPELKQFLVASGLGNHPEMIRLMVRAGKAISEDKVVTGGQPASAGRVDPATALYGKSTPQ